MRISYTIVDSPLGRMLVAATGKGICAVALSDSDSELKAALFSRYPAAEFRCDEAGLARWVDALLGYLNGRESYLDLPLDIQGTPFQRRIWQELRNIPCGSTRSYGEIASALGFPTAARAVARACATNPVALVIPCHRVVREDGELGGYRWGVERKRILLAQEQARAAARPVTNSLQDREQV